MTTITAKLKSGASFSYKFEVLDRSDISSADPVRLSAKPSSLTMTEKGVAHIEVGTNARDTANEMFSFEPADPRIVSIDENGVVTGLRPGKTTVTIMELGSESSLTYAVTVKPLDPSISKDKLVLTKTKFTYNGKVQKPKVKTVGGRALKEGVDYSIVWFAPKSKNAGTYRLNAVGKGLYTGTSASATYKIVKAANPLKLKGKTVKLKAKTLKRKNATVKANKAFSVKKKLNPCKLTYKKVSGNAKIKVSARGKVTVKKGLRVGTYRVKVKVTQKASKNYKAKTFKSIVFRVKVV